MYMYVFIMYENIQANTTVWFMFYYQSQYQNISTLFQHYLY